MGWDGNVLWLKITESEDKESMREKKYLIPHFIILKIIHIIQRLTIEICL